MYHNHRNSRASVANRVQLRHARDARKEDKRLRARRRRHNSTRTEVSSPLVTAARGIATAAAVDDMPEPASGPAFVGNPLSLSLQPRDFNAWVAQNQRAARDATDAQRASTSARVLHASSSARVRAGGASAAPRAAYKTPTMTVDDLSKPPKPWREFLRLDAATAAYAVPRTMEDAKARLDGNVYEFIGNYIRIGVIVGCAVVYRWPTAALGMLASARMYAWCERHIAVITETRHQIIRGAVTVASWLVMMYTKASAAVSMTMMCTLAFALTHGCCRRRDAPKLVKIGRHIGHGLKWEMKSPQKQRRE